MEYELRASLREDINQGWVWMTSGGFEPRSVVKITNIKTKKTIYCECLQIDKNYLTLYNQSSRKFIEPKNMSITMNSWYRQKLGGLDTNVKHDLNITAKNSFCGKFLANIGHPQVIVRMSMWLSALSLFLGVVGVVLGLWSVCLSYK